MCRRRADECCHQERLNITEGSTQLRINGVMFEIAKTLVLFYAYFVHTPKNIMSQRVLHVGWDRDVDHDEPDTRVNTIDAAWCMRRRV